MQWELMKEEGCINTRALELAQQVCTGTHSSFLVGDACDGGRRPVLLSCECMAHASLSPKRYHTGVDRRTSWQAGSSVVSNRVVVSFFSHNTLMVWFCLQVKALERCTDGKTAEVRETERIVRQLQAKRDRDKDEFK